MKVACITLLAIITLASYSKAFGQKLPTQKILPFDVAQAIAQEALAKCRADGYKITVTVVDHTGTPKVILHDDGSPIATIEVGRLKANSVIVLGRASGPRVNPGVQSQPQLAGTTNDVGGVPIKVGDQIIGAVSVAGAPGGEKDTACANAGLAKVAERLR